MSDIMAELNENVKGLRKDVADLTASLNMFATKSDVEAILLRRVGRVERQLALRARRRFATLATILILLAGLVYIANQNRLQVIADLCAEVNNTNNAIVAILTRASGVNDPAITAEEREFRQQWLDDQTSLIGTINC